MRDSVVARQEKWATQEKERREGEEIDTKYIKTLQINKHRSARGEGSVRQTLVQIYTQRSLSTPGTIGGEMCVGYGNRSTPQMIGDADLERMKRVRYTTLGLPGERTNGQKRSSIR